MRWVNRCAIVGAAVLGTAFLASSSLASVKTSTYGGGQQFWVTADSYASRSNADGNPDYVLNFHAAPGTVGELSGSAYHFYNSVVDSAPSQLDWWAQYEVPASNLPGSFNLTGTWYYWCRTTQPTPVVNDPAESHWLIVNGDPNDLNTSNPSDAQWLAGIQQDNPTERILQDLSAGGGTLYNYNWGWTGSGHTGGVAAPLAKTLAVVDGKVAWRHYEREAAPYNSLVDIIVWSNNPNYVPNDADWQNAVIPEPACGLLLAMGLPLILARRRSGSIQ